jgi:hypothetical protein
VGLLDRFFRRRERWSLDGRQPPWGDREAICSHIEEHLARHGDCAQIDLPLPDEARSLRPGGICWAAGAIDGVMSHHSGALLEGEEDDLAEEMAGVLLEVLDEVDDQRLARLYHLLSGANALEVVDPLLEQIGQQLPDDDKLFDRLAELAEWLVRRAPDREPVKLGMALLGRFCGERHRDLFVTLGSHEELTLYAAVALASSLADPSQPLWELAKRVHGWGRIHAVERLVTSTDPAIRRWLLCEGYKNEILTEYLAFTCATAGGLFDALAEAEVQGDLLDAAGELIEALVAGGPAEDIDDYEDGAAVVELYLQHLSKVEAPALEHLVTVGTVLGFVASAAGDAEERAKRGWNRERVAHVAELAEAFIARPSWEPQVLAALDQLGDEGRFHLAARASSLVGIDPWPHHFRRLTSCDAEDIWYHAMETDDRARVERVVGEALRRLPLSEIASGPADDIGLGPDRGAHRALDHVLTGLLSFPGLGWELVAVALQSPVVRNRHGALKVLEAWPRERWPEEARGALERASECEVCADLRIELMQLIRGDGGDAAAGS